MNTSQLQCCIECDDILRGRIIGVFAADQLPVTLSVYPSGFIANTDDHSRPGHHWIAFFQPRPGLIECFDSYGHTPDHYGPWFTQWLQRQSKTTIVWNSKQVQSDTSRTCGLYCLYFLRERLMGFSMDTIVRRFSSFDARENDRWIHGMFERVYPHCIKNECVYNQVCGGRSEL